MHPPASIDLNADVGEGAGFDAQLVPLVSSVNIACGAHAGDAATMRATASLALESGAAIGAHPGFSDREHFGRRELEISPDAAAVLVVGQVALLESMIEDLGARVGHLKLHGALYNMVSRDRRLADAVAEALSRHHPKKRLFALAGSALAEAGKAAGLDVVAEAFADRTYRRDGSLTPRSQTGSVITDEEQALRQALGIARDGSVLAADGARVAVQAQTLCLHGDSAHAVAFAVRIRRALEGAGIAVRP